MEYDLHKDGLFVCVRMLRACGDVSNDVELHKDAVAGEGRSRLVGVREAILRHDGVTRPLEFAVQTTISTTDTTLGLQGYKTLINPDRLIRNVAIASILST